MEKYYSGELKQQEPKIKILEKDNIFAHKEAI